MFSRKLALAFVLVCLPVCAWTQTSTLSGTIRGSTGSSLNSGSVLFLLMNCGGAPTSGQSLYIFTLNSSGVLSGTVQINNQTGCVGVSYYQVTANDSSGVLNWRRNYQVTGSTFDLSTATQLAQLPAPVISGGGGSAITLDGGGKIPIGYIPLLPESQTVNLATDLATRNGPTTSVNGDIVTFLGLLGRMQDSGKAMAGAGAGVTTGPNSGTTAGHVATFSGTTGQIQDSGKPLAGSGASVATGPNSGTATGHIVTYSDVAGTQQDSGITVASLAPKTSPAFLGAPTTPTDSVCNSHTTQIINEAYVQACTLGTSGALISGTPLAGQPAEWVDATHVKGVTAAQFRIDIGLVASISFSIGALTNIPAHTCWGPASNTTPGTISMTNLTTSMGVDAWYASDPTGIAGWDFAQTAIVGLQIWPSSPGTASWRVCNRNDTTITTGAITLNVSAK